MTSSEDSYIIWHDNLGIIAFSFGDLEWWPLVNDHATQPEGLYRGYRYTSRANSAFKSERRSYHEL